MAGRGDFSGVAVAPHALHRASGAGSRSHPPEDGGTLNRGVHGALEQPLVEWLRLAARLLQVDAVAPYQPNDAPAH